MSKYILAISCKDAEFLFDRNSIHYVSKASAKKIRDILNRRNYRLLSDRFIWAIHDISAVDPDIISRRFRIYKDHIFDEFI